MRSNGGKTVDCLIVGGGVIGLAVACELARRGVRGVALVERQTLGAESSHAAAGMLAPQAEAESADAFFRFACAGRDLYPAFAGQLRDETGIDIELDQTGTLYVALTDHDVEEIERRFRWQQSQQLAVERLTAADARLFEPALSPRTRLALRFPRDTQVEPRRLVAALAAAAQARGVELIVGAEVSALLVANNQVRGVEVACESIFAGTVIVAGGAWSAQLRATLHEPEVAPRVVPVRGQMLCFDARPPLVRHVIYSPRGYLVPRRDGRLLAGSTTEQAGFHKALTVDGLRSITTHAVEISPKIGQLPVIDSWAGLRPGTADNLPLIGASSTVDGLYYATGHYRNGILLAPLTAQLIADLVTRGETHALLADFAPARFDHAATQPQNA